MDRSKKGYSSLFYQSGIFEARLSGRRAGSTHVDTEF